MNKPVVLNSLHHSLFLLLYQVDKQPLVVFPKENDYRTVCECEVICPTKITSQRTRYLNLFG